MRKTKHSDGMTYMDANFMPDYRFGYFQIDNVRNLFCRRNINLRIHSDGFSVFLQYHFQNWAAKRSCSYSSADNILVWHIALWMCFKGIRFCQIASVKWHADIYCN